jgi:hypothetical protein
MLAGSTIRIPTKPAHVTFPGLTGKLIRTYLLREAAFWGKKARNLEGCEPEKRGGV